MKKIVGKPLTRSGTYLVDRAKKTAAKLGQRGRTSAKTEVIDGYMLRSTYVEVAGGLGTGLVFDPPGYIFLSPDFASPPQNGGPLWGIQHKDRDWFNSRYDDPLDPFSLVVKTFPAKVAVVGFCDEPPAAPTPFGLFVGATNPYPERAKQAYRPLAVGGTLIDSDGNEIDFVDQVPFGLPSTYPYGVNMQLMWGLQRALWVQLTERFLRQTAGAGWHFGPYLEKEITNACQRAVARCDETSKPGDMVFVAVTCKQDRPNYPADNGQLGVFAGVYSRDKILAAYADHPDTAVMNEGIEWVAHHLLATLFPAFATGPYIAKPDVLAVDDLDGSGDPQFATGFSRLWTYGYYDGGVPPTPPFGYMPSWVDRPVVVTLADRVRWVACLTFYKSLDKSVLDPGTYSPGEKATMIIGNGVARVDFGFDGTLLASELTDVDSTAGPNELAHDPVSHGAVLAGRSRFSSLVGATTVNGAYVEAIAEWWEPRLDGRIFSLINHSFVSPANRPFVDQANSGLRINHAGGSWFFNFAAEGFYPWAPLARSTTPGQWSYYKELHTETAPDIIATSYKEISLVVYAVSPWGALRLATIDLETGQLTLRPISDWEYGGPHPQVNLQPPPVLSCAQMAQYDSTGARITEAVLLFTFATVRSQVLVTRDSGDTWEVLVPDANSLYGAFYQPNTLRANYTYGSAALAVSPPEEP